MAINTASFATSAQVEAYEAAVTTISPRPGVECYILPGNSASSPRVMSCVVLPAP